MKNINIWDREWPFDIYQKEDRKSKLTGFFYDNLMVAFSAVW